MRSTFRTRVWDLPTRLFHWLLAAACCGSVVSAKLGGAAMVWHFRLGYLVLGLLLFRLAWGLVGGHWSRFRSFLYGPRATWRYLRGAPAPDDRFDVGHSPLAALSVFAMLGVLGAQVASGLVADDEIANLGPLNRFVSNATALAATAWHKGWGQWLLLGLMALHLAAIGWHALHRRNLVGPMLGGDKAAPAGTPATVDTVRTRLLALGVAVLAAVAVYGLVRLGQ